MNEKNHQDSLGKPAILNEPLQEILKRLHDIEQDLPKAAAAFKRIYPDGEFRIAISVEVTSHKTALVPLAIEVGGRVDDPATVDTSVDTTVGETAKP